MMIRQDFQTLPPKQFLSQIMDNVTKTYIFLWDRKDADNNVYLTWDDISIYHNKNSFRTSLRKLNNHGLLNYDQDADGIEIELVGWDEIEE